MAFYSHLFTLTSHMISWHLQFGRRPSLLMLTFSVTFTSVCHPKALSHLTIIHMGVVNVCFQICIAQWANSIKIVSGPHFINAKSLLVLVRAHGVRVSTRYWLCKINRIHQGWSVEIGKSAGTSYSRSRNVSRHVHILFYSEESTSDYLSCAYKSV